MTKRGKNVIIKTHAWEKPPEVLQFWWGESEPDEFQVSEDGTLTGLSLDHPRFHIMQREWKLEVIEVDEKEHEADESDVKVKKEG